MDSVLPSMTLNIRGMDSAVNQFCGSKPLSLSKLQNCPKLTTDEAMTRYYRDNLQGEMEYIMADLVYVYDINKRLCHKQRVTLFRCLITYLSQFLLSSREPVVIHGLLEKTIETMTVHAVLQPMVLMENDADSYRFTISLEPCAGEKVRIYAKLCC